MPDDPTGTTLNTVMPPGMGNADAMMQQAVSMGWRPPVGVTDPTQIMQSMAGYISTMKNIMDTQIGGPGAGFNQGGNIQWQQMPYSMQQMGRGVANLANPGMNPYAPNGPAWNNGYQTGALPGTQSAMLQAYLANAKQSPGIQVSPANPSQVSIPSNQQAALPAGNTTGAGNSQALAGAGADIRSGLQQNDQLKLLDNVATILDEMGIPGSRGIMDQVRQRIGLGAVASNNGVSGTGLPAGGVSR